jgi:site-specific DNA recombinase
VIPARRARAASSLLLNAIAKARQWMSDVVDGRAALFDEIAQHQGKVERHVRFLEPLACLSPRIVEAVARDAASRYCSLSPNRHF